MGWECLWLRKLGKYTMQKPINNLEYGGSVIFNVAKLIILWICVCVCVSLFQERWEGHTGTMVQSCSGESQVLGGLVLWQPRSEPPQASPCQPPDSVLITSVTKWKNLPAAKLGIGRLIRRWQCSQWWVQVQRHIQNKGGKTKKEERW